MTEQQPTKTLADAYKEGRPGKVSWSAQLYLAMDDATRTALFAQFMPINMELVGGTIFAGGISPQFAVIPPGGHVPTYEVEVTVKRDPETGAAQHIDVLFKAA